MFISNGNNSDKKFIIEDNTFINGTHAIWYNTASALTVYKSNNRLIEASVGISTISGAVTIVDAASGAFSTIVEV